MKPVTALSLPLALLAASALSLSAQSLVINEIHAAGYNAPAGEEVYADNDWIELRNTGSTAIDLAGYQLSDDPLDTVRWTFPPVTIPANGYLVVLANSQNAYDPVSGLFQTDFGLNNGGESVSLYAPSGAQIGDTVVFPTQIYGSSYGLPSNSSVYGFLQPPTPGAANVESSVAGKLTAPTFSAERGFYDAAFTVALSSDDAAASIYYTLDGSWPDAQTATLYTAPIQIDGTTILKAAAFRDNYAPSDAVTHTYIFTEDVIAQPASPDGFPSVWGPLQQADYAMDNRVLSFFPQYKDEIHDDLKAIPVLSIVMDQDELFGLEGVWGNAEGQGFDWERMTSMEFFSADGTESVHVNAGIRMSGGSARKDGNPKHNFRLYFRRDYGAGDLEYPIFAQGTFDGENAADSFEVLNVRSVVNFSWIQASNWFAAQALYIRDLWVSDTQLAMGHVSTHGRPVHLYLNGLYWGLYILQEQVDADFASDYFGGNADNWDVVKHYLVDGAPNSDTYEVKDGNGEAWDLAQQLADLDMSVQANYDQLAAMIDVVNHIDYFIMNIYAANSDGVVIRDTEGNNWYGARFRAAGEGFKFINWDAEFALVSPEEDKTEMHGDNNPATYYAAFRNNAEWRLLFADRVHKHLFNDGVLTVEKNIERLLYRADQIRGAIVGESMRWGDFGRPSFPRTRHQDWDPALARVIDTQRTNFGGPFFPTRGQFILGLFREDGLYPNLDAPVYSQHGGRVPFGYNLTMTSPDGVGTIYYTLDGTDPRLPGGAVSSGAQTYAAPVRLDRPIRVKSRVRNGSEWSALNEAEFVLDQEYGNLRITEIMYNPPDFATLDGDAFEFIELQNTGPTSLNLGGAAFTDGIDYTFPTGFELAPGAFTILVSSPEAFGLKYPEVAVDGTYTGQLRNSGERVAFSLANGEEIIALEYFDISPWPLVADGLGYSLVPVNPLSSGDPNNAAWWRASEELGGSPGAPDGANPAIAWFGNPTDAGDGWYYLDWFGYFRIEHFPWVWHLEHRWLYASGAGTNSYWFYDLDLGWVYRQPSWGAWMYVASNNEWAFFLHGTFAPRWMFFPGNGGWKTVGS